MNSVSKPSAVKVRAVLLVTFLSACAPPVADTPDKAFQGFTHAMLRNRRKDLERYASAEYIRQLEGVFDLMVVSAAWPANVVIEKKKTLGDKSALIARGVGLKGVTEYGTFLLQREQKIWKVIDGGWIRPLDEGATPPVPTEEDLDLMLNPRSYGDYGGGQ